MAQYLKDEIRDRILDAALREFAAGGFEGATVAGIARAAGISTGNVYRYFGGKEELLRAVLPAAWVERFRSLLRRRVEAAEGMSELPDDDSAHPFVDAADALLEFAIEHRRRVLILLKSAGEGPYPDQRAEVTEELVDGALRHFGRTEAGASDATFAFGLQEIYRNYVASLVRILDTFEDPGDIRTAIGTYERYHMVGLNAYFAPGRFV